MEREKVFVRKFSPELGSQNVKGVKEESKIRALQRERKRTHF